MISILFVIGQLGIGGAERQLVYLASHLDKQHYRVLVCSFTENAPLKAVLEAASIPVVIIPQVMKPDLTRPFKLYKLIRTFQPDLIHSYLFVANTWSRIVGKLMNTPVILTERNANQDEPISHRLIKRLLKPYGDALIANSVAGAQSVINSNEFNRKKVFVVHNGIPLEKFRLKVEPKKISELKQISGLQRHEKIIGIVGRLAYQKNHQLLFDSYPHIHQRMPNTKILCIGDGPLESELKYYVGSLGMADSVIFAGQRDDIPECLALMDVLVLPSRWEGCPNVILEAMATGIPVVATDVGGVKEVVFDSKTGYLVTPDNPQLFAEKIIDILHNPEKAEKFAREGRMRVAQHFSIDKMISQTEEIYKKIVSHE